jgi:N6-adenosine-specific RNA methylase IME4
MTDWPFDPLIPMKYGAILVDTPQKYEMYSAKGYEKSPEAHYPTMPLDEIKALPVLDLAGPTCLLFMWSTWPHLRQNMDVLEHWGFEYITGGSWTKRTVNWKLHFGTGYVQRSASEPYLIGKIGKPQTTSKSERNVIDAPIDVDDIPDKIEAIRREHSRKPVQMREMIDRLLPRAYKAELFAREAWDDNDIWGNQISHFEGNHA